MPTEILVHVRQMSHAILSEIETLNKGIKLPRSFARSLVNVSACLKMKYNPSTIPATPKRKRGIKEKNKGISFCNRSKVLGPNRYKSLVRLSHRLNARVTGALTGRPGRAEEKRSGVKEALPASLKIFRLKILEKRCSNVGTRGSW